MVADRSPFDARLSYLPPARRHRSLGDYLRGGTENWAVDRLFGDTQLKKFPLLGTVAQANRQFRRRRPGPPCSRTLWSTVAGRRIACRGACAKRTLSTRCRRDPGPQAEHVRVEVHDLGDELRPMTRCWNATRARSGIDVTTESTGLSEGAPDRFVIVSQCRFDDNFFRKARRAIDPRPRELEADHGAAVVCRVRPGSSGPGSGRGVVSEFARLGASGHKGCLLDCTRDLGDVRQKVLRGHGFHHCRTCMRLADVVTCSTGIGSGSRPIRAARRASWRISGTTCSPPRGGSRHCARPSARRWQGGAEQLVAGARLIVVALLLFLLGVKTGGG
jgi:hypothetical protein